MRLLLLERSQERTWWHQLVTSDQTGYAIEHCQFAPAPLELGPASENDLWSHIAEILHGAGRPLPHREHTLAALAAIDPERRPLFAAFAADALLARGNIRGWDRERLMRDVLKRERDFHWRPAGATGPYENLLCLSTMVGGVPVAVLEHPPPDIALPPSDAFQPSIYDAMTGASTLEADGDPPALAALQPDILGEFFVLDYLAPPHAATSQPAEKFWRAGWAQPIWAAYAFAAFLDRAKDDFSAHPTLAVLLAPPSDTEYQRHFWGMLAVNLINAYGNAGQIDQARAMLDRLTQLEADHPHEAEVRLYLARGAVNLITAYGNAGQIDQARAMLDRLTQLEADHPDEAEVRLCLAQGAVDLINAYGNAGQIDQARAMLERLTQLEADHPDEAEVRLELAKGAVNLITAYDNAGQIDQARAVAMATRDALLSDEFAEVLRGRFGEEAADGFLGFLRSLLDD